MLRLGQEVKVLCKALVSVQHPPNSHRTGHVVCEGALGQAPATHGASHMGRSNPAYTQAL